MAFKNASKLAVQKLGTTSNKPKANKIVGKMKPAMQKIAKGYTAPVAKAAAASSGGTKAVATRATVAPLAKRRRMSVQKLSSVGKLAANSIYKRKKDK